MSLFQAREWWSASSETDEDYDIGSLLIANIDNASDGNDKIITGSLAGKLRIYSPSSPESRRKLNTSSSSSTSKSTANTRAMVSSMNPNDLLLEMNLNAPILQLAAGLFQPMINGICLAILHPHKLIVYTVITQNSQLDSDSNTNNNNEFESKDDSDNFTKRFTSTGIQCRLQRQYEHLFTGPGLNSFSAYNMCYGPFGIASSRTGNNMFTTPTPTTLNTNTSMNGLSGLPDSIAVQSMDGQIAIYEGTSPGPRRQLDGILIPGPLGYIPRTDTFVTTSSDLCLVGFRYNSLLSTSGNTIIRSTGIDNNNATTTTTNKLPLVKPDWTINTGEITQYLHIGRFDKQTLDQVNVNALSNPYTLLSVVYLLLIDNKSLIIIRDND